MHHLERAVAARVRDFVVCGGTGALVPLAMGHVVVPTGSVRDEGTSFHYAEPGASIEVDQEIVHALVTFLEEQAMPHVTGLTLTTDAPFRETPATVAARREQGRLLRAKLLPLAIEATARLRR